MHNAYRTCTMLLLYLNSTKSEIYNAYEPTSGVPAIIPMPSNKITTACLRAMFCLPQTSGKRAGNVVVQYPI